MASPSSPCTGICTIDDPTGLCRGCGRSLDEIVRWGDLSEAQRRRVMALLPRRRAAGVGAPLDDAVADA